MIYLDDKKRMISEDNKELNWYAEKLKKIRYLHLRYLHILRHLRYLRHEQTHTLYPRLLSSP